MIPDILFLVVCGLLVTIEILSPNIVLKKVDLPTLGRPKILMNPDLNKLMSFRLVIAIWRMNVCVKINAVIC